MCYGFIWKYLLKKLLQADPIGELSASETNDIASVWAKKTFSRN